jgi:hypothetical protein
LQLRGYMRKAGGLLALFAGLYGVVAAMITLIVLGGLGSSASVDPKGVLLGWVGLGLSLMISILGAASIRTSSQRPVFLLLLLALMGAVISETLVSLCMAAAFFSGLLATGGRVSISSPSYGKPTIRIRIPVDYNGKKLRSRSV